LFFNLRHYSMAAYEDEWEKEVEGMGDRAPEPRNQTCGAAAADGSAAKVGTDG
jgi:hypothetical protein